MTCFRLKFAVDNDCKECLIKLNNLKDQPPVQNAVEEVFDNSGEEAEVMLKSGCVDENFALKYHAAFDGNKKLKGRGVSTSASKRHKSGKDLDEGDDAGDEYFSSDQSIQPHMPVTPIKHLCQPGETTIKFNERFEISFLDSCSISVCVTNFTMLMSL